MTTLPRESTTAAAAATRAGGLTPIPWGRVARGAVLPAAGLLAWQAVIWIFAPRPWLLPTPAQVSGVLWNERGRMWFHTEATLRATVTGLALAMIVGLILAAAISASRVVDRAVYPWVIALQAIPLLTLAPPMTVWLDYTTTQVVLAMVVCVFPIIVSGVDGLRSGDPQLVRMARTLGASRAWTWRHVALPGALTSLMSGLRMAAVFSVSGAVVAEYVGGERGLGYLTEIASAQFETAVAFAAIAWLAVMGIALFLVVCAVERLLLPHRFRSTRPTRRSS
jgi:ABC-type nitrate/sulfonate/bicarbonate transport system permease component